MADYIYNAEGRPQGFRLSSYIYTLDGTAVGRVWAEKAYTLDGKYVGALSKGMVVDKPNVSKRDLPPIPHPGNAQPVRNAESRRPISDSLVDVFHLLLPSREEEKETGGSSGGSGASALF